MAVARMADRAYLDGPDRYVDPSILESYQSTDVDVPESAAMLATAIDWWLCGPLDDGDGSYESILCTAVERAARLIAALPCTCDIPNGELCARCLAIGCDYSEHRTESCRRREIT
jgi:hypothetical protein